MTSHPRSLITLKTNFKIFRSNPVNTDINKNCLYYFTTTHRTVQDFWSCSVTGQE